MLLLFIGNESALPKLQILQTYLTLFSDFHFSNTVVPLHFRILRICAFQFLKPSLLCLILAFFYHLNELPRSRAARFQKGFSFTPDAEHRGILLIK